MKQLQESKSRACLGVVDRGGKPLTSHELLSIRDRSLFAPAKIYGNVMEPISVEDSEVLVTRQGVDASRIGVAELNTKSQ